MKTAAPALPQEKTRRGIVRPFGIIDGIHRKQFDDLTRLAALVCQSPIALITIVDEGQHWVTSHTGLPAELADREFGFGEQVARERDVLVVSDFESDERFVGQRPAPAEWAVRFLAGVPLLSVEAEVLGTLCVLDRQPRPLTAEQTEALRALGRQVVAQLELRRSLTRLTRASTRGLRAEHILAEERNLLRTLINSVPDSICLKDLSGRYVLDNAAHQRSVGARSPEAVVGKTLFDFFPEELAGEYDADDQAVLRLGQPLLNREMPTVDAAGVPQVLLTSKIPMRDWQGKLTGLICISRDITLRKRTEAAMAKLAAIVDYSSDAIISQNVDETIVSWNAGAARLFGYRADEIIGRPITLLLPPELAEESRHIQEQIRQGRRVETYETVRLHKNGRRIDISIGVSPIRDAAGDIIGASVISRDITEVKRAQDELRRSEERFRLLVDGVKDYAIYQLGVAGHIVSWNAGAERIFRYPAAEIVGESVERFWPGPPASGAAQLAAALECATTAGRHESEGWLRCKDGTQFYAHQVTTVLRDADGRPRGFVQVTRDVTELKHKTQDLEDSNHLLEQALNELQRTQHQLIQEERLRALGQMATGIAHDFNNALAPVLGYSELLLRRPESLKDTTRVARYLELIHLNAKLATQIGGRLRDFYRYRDDKEDRFDPVQLDNLIEHAIELTRPRWENEAGAAGLTIRVETQLQPLPPVAGNASELCDAMVNLIYNAVEAILAAGRDGLIRVRTSREGSHALMEISDTGAGMDENTRQHCFEPFFTTKTAHGRGLGLSTVYGVVSRHGGLITVDSTPGQGTTVLIRLPVQTTKEVDGLRVEVGAPASPRRILLVDDEPDVREVVALFLREEGHAVELAANGHEALEKFRAGRFDLVVTDKAMPGMKGTELATAIKAASATTPVMLLTGFGNLMNAAGERPDGVDLVLGKPVSMIYLSQCIARLCAAPA